MTPLERVPELREDQDVMDAVAVLRAANAAHGLVLDGPRLLGLLSLSDIARALTPARAAPPFPPRAPGAPRRRRSSPPPVPPRSRGGGAGGAP